MNILVLTINPDAAQLFLYNKSRTVQDLPLGEFVYSEQGWSFCENHPEGAAVFSNFSRHLFKQISRDIKEFYFQSLSERCYSFYTQYNCEKLIVLYFDKLQDYFAVQFRRELRLKNIKTILIRNAEYLSNIFPHIKEVFPNLGSDHFVLNIGSYFSGTHAALVIKNSYSLGFLTLNNNFVELFKPDSVLPQFTSLRFRIRQPENSLSIPQFTLVGGSYENYFEVGRWDLPKDSNPRDEYLLKLNFYHTWEGTLELLCNNRAIIQQNLYYPFPIYTV